MSTRLKRNLSVLFILIVLVLTFGLRIETLKTKEDRSLNSSLSFQSSTKLSSNQVIIPSVPIHYQINEYYCGPASLEMIFDYYGPDISQDEIAEVARTYEAEGGTYSFELRRAAHFSHLSMSNGLVIPGHIVGYTNRKIGYAVFESNLQNTTCLKYLIDEGFPILVMTWSSLSKIYKHFRVVVGYTYDYFEIITFILHDPGIGPFYEMEYTEFIELWESNGNWSLLVSPWIVNVTYPEKVDSGSNFLISAIIEYPCPKYFNYNKYPATSCYAKIILPSGYHLTPGENITKQLNNGTLKPNDIAYCQWNVTTGSENKKGKFKLEISGKINGIVQEHYFFRKYSYIDYIGATNKFIIEIVGGFPTKLVIIAYSSSIGAIGVCIPIIYYLKRYNKRKNSLNN